MMKSFIILTIISAINIFSQSERLTKDLENGYTWIRMEAPAQYYSTSKDTYLSSILERIRLTGEKYPEIASLGCKEEIKKLYEDGKSGEISMSDIVRKIDDYYSDENKMTVPIIFAYCYTIKKLSGASKAELAEYEKQVMEFCKE
ncbi:MAG: hypothetical protein IPM14_02100 [bacterium]|nr:hypothetical protein [bacterium]